MTTLEAKHLSKYGSSRRSMGNTLPVYFCESKTYFGHGFDEFEGLLKRVRGLPLIFLILSALAEPIQPPNHVAVCN